MEYSSIYNIHLKKLYKTLYNVDNDTLFGNSDDDDDDDDDDGVDAERERSSIYNMDLTKLYEILYKEIKINLKYLLSLLFVE